MAGGRWAGSSRRSRLPADWPAIRRRILKRDNYSCTWPSRSGRCGQPATDVDHIVNGDDHRDENLRSLCSSHHQAKSSAEGGRAAQAKRIPRTRPIDPHPGLIR